MNLWVDDIRKAPKDWYWARSATEAIRAIDQNQQYIKRISLDHDICHQIENSNSVIVTPLECKETFAAVARFIARVYTPENQPIITIHSGNPVGVIDIRYILNQAGLKAEYKHCLELMDKEGLEGLLGEN